MKYVFIEPAYTVCDLLTARTNRLYMWKLINLPTVEEVFYGRTCSGDWWQSRYRRCHCLEAWGARLSRGPDIHPGRHRRRASHPNHRCGRR
ncbi:hypothetical protein XFF7767_990002 [Xanthomonas citri pv. fuscans]|nr:hypothetical protein XFF7767_990002 [Xanthomonas citri pv. fuscans]SOO12472.1 hypothetical protein XFF7766_1110003 [Xanthomonas citri pv. fuscans]